MRIFWVAAAAAMLFCGEALAADGPGIAIAIDGRRPLAPLVAAETAAHPGLSEL